MRKLLLLFLSVFCSFVSQAQTIIDNDSSYIENIAMDNLNSLKAEANRGLFPTQKQALAAGVKSCTVMHYRYNDKHKEKRNGSTKYVYQRDGRIIKIDSYLSHTTIDYDSIGRPVDYEERSKMCLLSRYKGRRVAYMYLNIQKPNGINTTLIEESWINGPDYAVKLNYHIIEDSAGIRKMWYNGYYHEGYKFSENDTLKFGYEFTRNFVFDTIYDNSQIFDFFHKDGSPFKDTIDLESSYTTYTRYNIDSSIKYTHRKYLKQILGNPGNDFHRKEDEVVLEEHFNKYHELTEKKIDNESDGWSDILYNDNLPYQVYRWGSAYRIFHSKNHHGDKLHHKRKKENLQSEIIYFGGSSLTGRDVFKYEFY